LNRITAFGAIRRETEAQKLSLPWPCHRALLLVYPDLELRRDESHDARHHSLPRTSATNVHVAEICRKALSIINNRFVTGRRWRILSDIGSIRDQLIEGIRCFPSRFSRVALR